MSRASSQTVVVKPPSVNPQKTFHNRVGEVHGLLTVIKYLGRDKWNKAVWLCVCKCGKTIESTTQNLITGNTTSCGCEHSRLAAAAQYKHGMATSRLYAVWNMMISRCHNPKNKAYHNYGGRGIKVCDRWRFGENGKTGFECFHEDIGERVTKGYSIDRVNNDGDYEPGNIRWATQKEQMNNTRRSKRNSHAPAPVHPAMVSQSLLPL